MKSQSAPLLLSQIKPGKRVLIASYAENDVPLKMLEMGLLPGNEVLVKRLAPMHDPIHIEVGGYDLALRKEEAALIVVRELVISEASI